MVKYKRNALLAVPPRGAHGLGVAAGRHFRSVMGRPTTDEDYHGVHTTGDELIAYTYALGTSDQDSDSYPVIITLDVRGLRALPDVDALVQATETFSEPALIREVERELSKGRSIYDIAERFNMIGADVEVSEVVGEHPANVIMEDQYRYSNPVQAIINAFPDDDAKQNQVLGRWLALGKIPDQVMIEIIDQKRYLHDFDLDRVIEVRAAKRWWEEVLDQYWDSEDDDEIAKAEAIEAAGYQLVTIEDVPGSVRIETVQIYEGSKSRGAKPEYHGTSSTRLQQAFPGMRVPPDPFPVTEVEWPEEE